mmetsp:Transcript_1160/g.1375  ORF Transcript_1160/g.1375 Transcript_1160/m.1375 type:complete len:181 (-) Transcript_1160:4-546(-)
MFRFAVFATLCLLLVKDISAKIYSDEFFSRQLQGFSCNVDKVNACRQSFDEEAIKLLDAGKLGCDELNKLLPKHIHCVSRACPELREDDAACDEFVQSSIDGAEIILEGSCSYDDMSCTRFSGGAITGLVLIVGVSCAAVAFVVIAKRRNSAAVLEGSPTPNPSDDVVVAVEAKEVKDDV